jgi:hypothetical protein
VVLLVHQQQLVPQHRDGDLLVVLDGDPQLRLLQRQLVGRHLLLLLQLRLLRRRRQHAPLVRTLPHRLFEV